MSIPTARRSIGGGSVSRRRSVVRARAARCTQLRKRDHVSERRTTATPVIRALDAELQQRRAELGVLERAREVLERSLDEHGDRCDRYHPDSPCCGKLSARYCRFCSYVVMHCEAHGGIRASSHAADLHRAAAHAGPDADDPAPDHEERLPTGSSAVPMDGVPSSPRARGRGEPAGEANGQAKRRAADLAPAEPREPRTREQGTADRLGIIRRAPPGHRVDR